MTVVAPGVAVEWSPVAPARPPSSGVPAFLGRDPGVAPGTVRRLDDRSVRNLPARDGLAAAVGGFFANGGRACRVVAVEDGPAGLTAGLAALEDDEDVDLVAAPDLLTDPAVVEVLRRERRAPDALLAAQRVLVEHCRRRRDRFAVLDAVPGSVATVRRHRRDLAEPPEDGFAALYHPMLQVHRRDPATPPCGHVAGIYARTDATVGPHRAPANVRVEDVVGPGQPLTDDDADELAAAGVNVLRVYPGDGLRVWGARTLVADEPADSPWRAVGVRRTAIALTRYVSRFLTSLVAEPNDQRLWDRVVRELTEHLDGLHRAGALRGSEPAHAYSVRCDATTNPPSSVAAGLLQAEIGLALARPAEHVVLRVTSGPDGPTTS